MSKLCHFLLLLFLPFNFQAQSVSAIIDKLKDELKSGTSEKRTAVIYSDLTWYYSTVSIDSALVYGSKAVVAAQNLADSTLTAQVYSDMGAVYFRKGDFDNSKLYYLKSYKIRKLQNDAKGLAKINNNLANIYEKTQQYKLAMSSFLEALKYFESINDQKNIHVIKGNVGLILLKIKNYDKALAYIQEAVKYQQINNNNDELCVSCLNLGNVYLQLNDTVNALNYYRKSMKACEVVGNKKGLASGYNNIASIKTEQKKSEVALKLYAQSQKIRNELNSELDKANLDLNIATELVSKGNYNQAKKMLCSVESVFTVNKTNSNLIPVYKAFIVVFSHTGTPDSVQVYVNKLMALNAALLQSKIQQQTAELETKYQTLKKEKLLLQAENEVKERNMLLLKVSVLAIILALVGIIVFVYQRSKRSQLAKEFELKAEIAEIETQNLLQEQRISISRDLHDNIGSHLTFIISSINNLMFKYKEQNAALIEQLRKVEAFAAETISELRDTIWAMDAINFRFEDLRNRLINFLEKQKTINAEFKTEFELDESLSEQIISSFAGITIYRIIQEFTNNTLKHSGAKRLTINIQKQADIIQIRLADNGSGFDLKNCNRGHGLYNMEKRCQELNGTINIASEPGRATSVLLSFNADNLK